MAPLTWSDPGIALQGWPRDTANAPSPWIFQSNDHPTSKALGFPVGVCHRVRFFLGAFFLWDQTIGSVTKMNMIWRMDHLIALINKCYLFSHLLGGSGSKNWPVCWREMMVYYSRDLEGPSFIRWTMTLEGRLFLCHVGNLNWVAEGWYADRKVWGWQ